MSATSTPSPSSTSTSAVQQQHQEIKPPTISKIQISEADLEKLRKILQSNNIAPYIKIQSERRLTGVCILCGDIPDYIITRYYEGLQKIEKYCAKCLQQEQEKGNIETYQA